LNKARQRKLEARRRRLEALHSVPSEKDSVVENTNKDLVTVPVVYRMNQILQKQENLEEDQ